MTTGRREEALAAAAITVLHFARRAGTELCLPATSSRQLAETAEFVYCLLASGPELRLCLSHAR